MERTIVMVSYMMLGERKNSVVGKLLDNSSIIINPISSKRIKEIEVTFISADNTFTVIYTLENDYVVLDEGITELRTVKNK